MDAETKRDGLTNGDVQKDSVMSNGMTSNQRHVASYVVSCCVIDTCSYVNLLSECFIIIIFCYDLVSVSERTCRLVSMYQVLPF